MSTLAVVEEIMRAEKRPLSVREIVELSGERLPTKSKTPDTVVARDLSMDIKKHGEASRFIRTSPGRYTMRDLVAAKQPSDQMTSMTEAALTDSRAPAKPARAQTSDEGASAAFE